MSGDGGSLSRRRFFEVSAGALTTALTVDVNAATLPSDAAPVPAAAGGST